MISLTTPLKNEDVKKLVAGDFVNLSGVIYTGRDAAHLRFRSAIEQGELLPFDPCGQIIYYVGPTPAKPGHAIGSAGPTTSSRMDSEAPLLIQRGLKGMIGKGKRSPEVIQAMKDYLCVYFGAIEGTAALLSHKILSCQVVAYEDLGPEAVFRLVVEDFPVVVVNDVEGRDLYDEGKKRYQKI